jgi:small subunit ribosomal protein S3Ae
LCSAHPFAKKEWYNVLVPGFDKRCIGLTPCNKSAGLVNAADNLRGRVITTSLADCNNASEQSAFRKLRFEVNEIKGYDCYTNFNGMDITRDKSQSMMKKWHTTIEAFVQAKTLDGFILRMFCIAFTKKTAKQVKATAYAKASHQLLIRKKMTEIMQSTIQKSSLKELVKIL